MNRHVKILFAFGFLFCTACYKSTRRCEDALPFKGAAANLTFVDQSGEYIYTPENSKFDYNNFSVTDTSGRTIDTWTNPVLMVSPPDTFNVISFLLFQFDEEVYAFSGELCKTYFVQYNSADTDTITVCYSAKHTSCDIEFESVRLLVNGSSLVQQSHSQSIDATIVK